MGARYAVAGYRGIAFHLIGWATTTEPIKTLDVLNDDGEYDPVNGREVEVDSGEFEEVDDYDRVRAVMVGDDRVFVVEVDDLTRLDDGDYCSQCGQVGCTADGR
jgi:hypothetical protein